MMMESPLCLFLNTIFLHFNQPCEGVRTRFHFLDRLIVHISETFESVKKCCKYPNNLVNALLFPSAVVVPIPKQVFVVDALELSRPLAY